MSWFIIISGNALQSADHLGIQLVPINEAQDYVKKIASSQGLLPDATWLVDDSTRTSHDVIETSRDEMFDGKVLNQTKLGELLTLAFDEKTKIFIWWAGVDFSGDFDVFEDESLFQGTVARELLSSNDTEEAWAFFPQGFSNG